MPTTVYLQCEPDLVEEILDEFSLQDLTATPSAPVRSLPQSAEIAVALGSAGAFTALYQVLNKLLEKDKDREFRLERQGLSISIKAHSLPEEQALLAQLTPELLKERTKGA